MNELIEKIKPYSNLITVVAPLWIFITGAIVYESELVKVHDIAGLETKAEAAEKDFRDCARSEFDEGIEGKTKVYELMCLKFFSSSSSSFPIRMDNLFPSTPHEEKR